jgi:endonuclease/exonuclease/phosphatase (EEP) superfamily protein YafD
MKKAFLNFLRVSWIVVSDLCFAFFFVWFILSFFTHGRFAWVNLTNMFAFEVFLLLLPFALAGVVYRLRRLQIASGIAVLLFLFTFGKFFSPKGQTALAASDSLKVMTYNMLAFTSNPSAVVDVIRGEDADIVFIQETSFAVAELLEKEMKGVYPYQIHYPSKMPLGTSIVSKYPFTEINATLKSRWVGKPILLEVDWNRQKIIVVNFHMIPTPLSTVAEPIIFNKISDVRKEEANALIEFLQARPDPAIVAGDANDVFLNDPCIMLVNSGLQDAWVEAGFGLGHTFPGNKSPGASRVHVGDFYIPEWLVRIDYIFATPEWDVISAHIARTDGYSDHRGVVATLHLK